MTTRMDHLRSVHGPEYRRSATRGIGLYCQTNFGLVTLAEEREAILAKLASEGRKQPTPSRVEAVNRMHLRLMQVIRYINDGRTYEPGAIRRFHHHKP